MSLLIAHRLAVRFSDCDPLGHVNNAVYLTYLEQARFTLWRAQMNFMARHPSDGGPRGAGFILARAEIDFRAQVRYGTEIEVRLSLDRIGRTSFSYTYELEDVATRQIVATAKTVQVWFDYDRSQPEPIGDDLRRTLATPVS